MTRRERARELADAMLASLLHHNQHGHCVGPDCPMGAWDLVSVAEAALLAVRDAGLEEACGAVHETLIEPHGEERVDVYRKTLAIAGELALSAIRALKET